MYLFKEIQNANSKKCLWKWISFHLVQKTPHNHAIQEVKILVFKTLVKLPRPSRIPIGEKSLSIWRMLLFRSNVCHVVTMAELVSMSRPNSGATHRVAGPKKVLIFFCMCLKMQRVMLEIKNLDTDFLVIEHSQMNKAFKMWLWTYRTHGWVNSYMSSPCQIGEDPYWKRADCF